MSYAKDFRSNKIPVELDDTLQVCVVSSKDYGFLCRLARIVSCIMGIETIVLEWVMMMLI